MSAETWPRLEQAPGTSIRGAGEIEQARTLGNLGRAALFSGQGDTVAYYRETLALREARLGAEHPDTIRARADLGTALVVEGPAPAEGEALMREALRLLRANPQRDEGQEACMLHNLAGLPPRCRAALLRTEPQGDIAPARPSQEPIVHSETMRFGRTRPTFGT